MADHPLKKKQVDTDLRKYAHTTNIRLVLWFVLLLFTVGLGLVWIIYGRNAALLGFFCLIGAGIPIALIAAAIFGLDFFVKKSS